MPYITGKVSKINVKGLAPNSPKLEFVVEHSGGQMTLFLTARPDFEPHFFAAMTSVVVGAFYAGGKVTVGYWMIPGETSRASEIEVS
jgi:hypothetical protein